MRSHRIQISTTEEIFQRLTEQAEKLGTTRALLASLAMQVGLESLQLAMQPPYVALMAKLTREAETAKNTAELKEAESLLLGK